MVYKLNSAISDIAVFASLEKRSAGIYDRSSVKFLTQGEIKK